MPDRNRLILMYHRISDNYPDPWNLCVTPQNFEAQMETLCSLGDVVSLSEIASRSFKADGPSPKFCISFDDGYVDNLTNALPILERQGVPAVVFIANGYIDSPHTFYWDELASIFLTPGTLPELLSIRGDDFNISLDLRPYHYYSESDFDQHRNWHFGETAPPTSRQVIYMRLWLVAKQLPPEPRDQLMAAVRSWSKKGPKLRYGRPLSTAELKKLAASPNIEIGAHTVHHLALADHPIKVQQEEILQSRKILEDMLGCPVQSFSYPHGDYTKETMQLLTKAGFRLGCSTRPRAFGKRHHPLALPRIHVKDWDRKAFRTQIEKYLA